MRPPAADRLSVERLTLAVVGVMLVARGMVAGEAMLSPDEAYYWLWTRPLQPAYYEHPAMVAYWIRAGTQVLGDSSLGLRLVAVLSSAVVSALAWDTARLAFRSRRAGALAALWLNCTILFGVTGVIVTPDSPLLVFWALALWGLVRLMTGGGGAWLYAIGLALGLGATSKYTMALILPGILVTVLIFPALRSWWRRPQPYLAAGLAVLVMTPLLRWNLEHDFASFGKQIGHALAAAPPHPMRNLGNFVASQIGLVTPLILPFCLWGMGWALWSGWTRRRPEWFLMGAVSLSVLIFFCIHALGNVVQAHWAGPAYYGGMIATAGWLVRLEAGPKLRRLLVAAPLLGAVMTLAVFLHATSALLPIPVRMDPLRRLSGWDQLAEEVQRERVRHPGAFLFVQKHEIAGVLTFYLPDHPLVFLKSWRIRPSFYTADDVAALRGRDGIYLTRARDDVSVLLAPRFERVSLLRQVTLNWGGQPADRYNIYLAEGYKGGVFVQGDGLMGAMDAPCSREACDGSKPADPLELRGGVVPAP